MAVTWSFKAAGLACAVCAGLAGLRFVKSGPRRSAGFAARQRRSCGRKGRFVVCEAEHIDEDLGVL